MKSQSNSDIKQAILDEVKLYMRPELINRIDEILVFSPLNLDAIKQIANLQIQILKQRLEKQNYTLEVEDSALEYLAQKGFDPVYCGRLLKRTIQHAIENPLSIALLTGNYVPNYTFKVYLNGDRLEIL